MAISICFGIRQYDDYAESYFTEVYTSCEQLVTKSILNLKEEELIMLPLNTNSNFNQEIHVNYAFKWIVITDSIK